MATRTKANAKGRAKARTSRNIGDEIIQGLQDAIAFERGADNDTILRSAPISARGVSVAPAPDYSAAKVVAIRKALGVSQVVFAQALNVSPETARGWEQSKFPPSGPTKRLLQIAERHPEIILGEIMVKPGSVARSRPEKHGQHAGTLKRSARARR